MSYTSFSYSDIKVSNKEIEIKLQNVGKYIGSEVAQLYIQFPTEAKTPLRQLRGFYKTNELNINEIIQIKFPLKERDLSVWDDISHNWRVVKGKFKVFVGASSDDIRLQGEFLN